MMNILYRVQNNGQMRDQVRKAEEGTNRKIQKKKYRR